MDRPEHCPKIQDPENLVCAGCYVKTECLEGMAIKVMKKNLERLGMGGAPGMPPMPPGAPGMPPMPPGAPGMPPMPPGAPRIPGHQIPPPPGSTESEKPKKVTWKDFAGDETAMNNFFEFFEKFWKRCDGFGMNDQSISHLFVVFTRIGHGFSQKLWDSDESS